MGIPGHASHRTAGLLMDCTDAPALR
jgi:hypothetical protein